MELNGTGSFRENLTLLCGVREAAALFVVTVQEGFFRHVGDPIVVIIGMQCRVQNCLGCRGKGTHKRSWRQEKAFREGGLVEGATD